jgi:16S rRNA (guanine966-N2)-methyltransferase
MKKQRKPVAKSSGHIRIIGGQWKGRKLSVANVPGLRPTPDRVRETLFNWLQFDILNTRCLDLFAGSGALGFEAVSRGAKDVVLVEKHPRAFNQLEAILSVLPEDQVAALSLVNDDAYRFLKRECDPFDVIFLDPPYRKEHLPEVLDHIIENKLLAAHGYIYLELEQENMLDFSNWCLTVRKTTKSGQVDAFFARS